MEKKTSKKILIIYLIATCLNIIVFICYYNINHQDTNHYSTSYEDGGEGLTLIRTKYDDDTSTFKFYDETTKKIINSTAIDFNGTYLDVFPFSNGYAKVVTVDSNNQIVYNFINKDGELAFVIPLRNVPRISMEGYSVTYERTGNAETDLYNLQKIYEYIGVSDVYNGIVTVAQRSTVNRTTFQSGMISTFDTTGTLINKKNLGKDFDKAYLVDYTDPFYLDDVGFKIKEVPANITVDGYKDRYIDQDLNIVESFNNPLLLQIGTFENGISFAKMWDDVANTAYNCYIDINGNKIDDVRYDYNGNVLTN